MLEREIHAHLRHHPGYRAVQAINGVGAHHRRHPGRGVRFAGLGTVTGGQRAAGSAHGESSSQARNSAILADDHRGGRDSGDNDVQTALGIPQCPGRAQPGPGQERDDRSDPLVGEIRLRRHWSSWFCGRTLPVASEIEDFDGI